MKRLLAAGLLAGLLAAPARAKDPLMEALGDPAKVAELLKERKPKTAHLEAALRDWPSGNKVASAKLLLRAGAKPPKKEGDQYLALWSAVKAEDAELVRLLAAAGVKVDAREADASWPETALTQAAHCYVGEAPEVLSALLDAGAAPGGVRAGDDSPLTRATRGCCVKHMAVLLERGAVMDPPTPPDRLCPAAARLLDGAGFRLGSIQDAESALVRGDTETVRIVLASTQTPKLDGTRSPVRQGLRRALFELSAPDLPLAALIIESSDVDALSGCEDGRLSLLQAAAKMPDGAPVARFLLERGARPDQTCPAEEKPPLTLAACGGSTETLRLLLRAGAAPGTVLHDSIRRAISWGGCPLAHIQELIAGGAPIDAEIPVYGTPLQTALSYYENEGGKPSLELIDLLLAAKPRLKGFGLQAPLLRALRWPEVARRLRKAGADINEVTADGSSLLHLVPISHEGRVAPLALALELGADPNAADRKGWTPLMGAAYDGRAEHVSLLLKHGADPERVEASGRNALQLALDAGKLEAAHLLRGVTKTAAVPPAAAGATAPDVKRLVAEAVAEARAKDRPAPAPAAPAVLTSDVDKPGYSSPEDADAYAVVVGVEEYSDLPKASFAERDAAAVRRHFKALGVPDRNLVLLSGQKAVRSALAKYLESWLPKNATERSRVYFYFSGHGAPDPASGRAYLMPWDGDPSFLADTAYPVERLYKTLDGLKAKQVVVALDACFSGAGGRSVLPEGARPLVTKVQKASTGRLVVLAATQPDQITGVIKEQGHGIFTYHFLKGLAGAATGPDGSVTSASLFSYLKPRVQDEARRQNRDQTPSLSGPDGAVLKPR